MKQRKLLSVLLSSILAIIFVTTPVYAEETEYRYPRSIFNITEEEHDAVLKVIRAEGAEEDAIGHMMIVEVICNRAAGDKCFPNTVVGVVSQKGQFSTWKSRNKKKVMQDDIDAYEEVRLQTPGASAMWGYATVDPSRYVYFCTPKAYKKRGYKYMHNVFQYGNHVFGTQ